ncbi:MAG: radical SAM protein [Christensenellales bacterium]|jgi:molybdenum cofactor biosynthesis enzyme MoaA
MKDQFGREINYLRVSITDRCNLRCKYCMPSYVPGVPHEDILRYEELMRICRAAVSLGIDRFKITGGEPFVRKGTADFIAQLKAEPGVKNVTVTTNGTGLHDALPRLIQVGVDGVNVSLDAVDADKYSAITGAHYFSADINDNKFPVQIVETIEEPFEWTVKFKYRSQDEDSEPIWWRIAKAQRLTEIPKMLGIAPRDILLLLQ